MLTPGSRLGPYEVGSLLGQGGMGEVYRARDSRLARDVAIKVMSGTVANDRDRLRRFEQEARAASALNHPNIRAIYDVGEQDGVAFAVGELLEGETLRERLGTGPLPPRKAVEYARQVAEGLAAAHAKGIVHRDLKPENLFLTRDGRIKILDFGLAKLIDRKDALGGATTETSAGMILGTAGYMAPEQVRAQPIDARADIFAFGTILYEMLTGRRAFAGESIADTFSAILSKEPPDLALHVPDLPAPLDRIVRRCLEKPLEMRFQSASDLAFALEALPGTRSSTGDALRGGDPSPTRALVVTASRRWLRALVWSVVVGGALAAGVSVGRLALNPGTSGPVGRLHLGLALPEGTRLDGFGSPVVTLSPDGRKIAFVANRGGTVQLYVRHLDRREADPVARSEGAEGPFFSPDSEWLGFAAGGISGRVPGRGELRRISLRGGLTQSICELPDFFGATWAEDGFIYFIGAQSQGLWKVPAEGGSPRQVGPTNIPGRTTSKALLWPQILPGGKSVLVVSQEGPEIGRAAVLDLASGNLKDLGVTAAFARYAPTGHLVFTRVDGSLAAAPFDADRLEVTRSPVAIIQDLSFSGNAASVFAFSDTGALAYTTGYVRDSRRELYSLVRIDRHGGIKAVPVEPATFISIAVSPDGNGIAGSTWDGTLWVYDLARNTRLMLPKGRMYLKDAPVWSPDGKTLAFLGADIEEPAAWSLFWQSSDASGTPEPLTTMNSGEAYPGSWSPDGRSLVYHVPHGTPGRNDADIRLVSPGQNQAPTLLVGTPTNETNPRISPDGRWLVYESQESGRSEIYAQPFPALGEKITISTDGGSRPRWSRDGREIYYWKGTRYDGRVMAVAVAPTPSFRARTPTVLFAVEGVRDFDVAPGDQGFFAIKKVPDSGIQTHFDLVLNWFDDLRRLAPGRSP